MKFKTFLTSLALCLGLAAAPTGAAQTTDDLGEPIITFKTNIYDTYGAENTFYIYLGTTETDYYDVDCGYGTSEYEVTSAYYNDESSSMVGTAIACSVPQGDGIVKIYGDASKIDYFVARGCYIEWIDMKKCVNLDIIDVCYNELKSLDLTPFTKLEAIYVGGNTFSAESPLKIGAPKPLLTILEMDIVDHLDQSFNLSDYPSMIAFDAYHNLDLRNVDPTGCPNLMTMSLDLTNVASLDVTKNPKLISLNISDTKIRDIDLSKNTNLTTLIAEHLSGNINTDYHLNGIDLSNNTKLTLLRLGGNKLTNVDISKNTALVTFNVRNNNISKIDVTNNTALYSVDLAYNDFDFATLPLPQSTWYEYYYQRNPMACEKSYAIGAEIDFSKRVLRESTETYARVMLDTPDAEPAELDSTYYTYSNGVVKFLQLPTDSVYIEFANTAFPDYSINSAKFLVKNADDMGKPNKELTFSATSASAGKTVTFKVGVTGATATAPCDFYVDVNGIRSTFTATTDGYPAADNVSITLPASGSATVDIYIPDGKNLSAFSLADLPLSSIDVTAASQLQHLTVTGCRLLKIDTKYNRLLKDLNLSNNRLSGTFTLAGVYGDYEKNILTDINLSKNYITDVTFVNVAHILKLNLADNRLSTFSLKNFDSLTDVDLSNNKLSGDFSLAYQAEAVNVNLSGNSISSLTTVDMPNLKSFNIANNAMTLATLPDFTAIDSYTYAPQQQLAIVAYAPAINLTEQNVKVNNYSTVFTLKKVDGTPLTEGVDFTGTGGAFKFINTELGNVYCEMTHQAFPDFTGNNVFRTTATTVTGAPTTVVASFTTTENSETGSLVLTGHKSTAVYIDWRGDGTEFLQYPMVSSTYTAYTEQKTYAGANVKVYTYESPEDIKVFSVDGVAMSKLDASPLTKVETFTVCNAGLDEKTITMPASEALYELNLEGNKFSTADFSQYASLTALSIGANNYTTFDASKSKKLQLLNIANNSLTSLKLDNPILWSLAAGNNQLASISFAACPMMSQVVLSQNLLKNIDITPIKNTLRALFLDGNLFTFATLPVPADYPNLGSYFYGNQALLDVECVEGVVDLSELATICETPTVFTWFYGDATYDEDNETYVGEVLASQDDDDPEYNISGGVTSFLTTFDTYVTGVLYNETFPNLYLLTKKITVDKPAGVEDVAVDGFDANAPADIYNLSGVKVRSNAELSEVNKLASGVYIVVSQGEARKVLVK